jgi:hypothetical protein
MNHNTAEQRMQEALDGVLAPAERAALDAHLATCAQCRAAWEELSAFDTLLTHAARIQPAPAGFAREALARINDPLRAGAWETAPNRDDWLRALAGAGVLAAGGTALALVLVLPALGVAGQLFRVLTSPGQWPVLIAGIEDQFSWLAALGRFLSVIVRAFDLLLREHPILIVALFGVLGLVAVWAWTVQQLTDGRSQLRAN